MTELLAAGEVKIPPYPGVAAQLNKLISGDQYGLKDIARLVSSDQALAADTLRYANSALHGANQRVSSVAQAITRLGADQVIRLAFASGLGAVARSGGLLTELRHSTWQNSVTSAILCQNLGARRKLNGGEAFTCGLLHNFGVVVAISCVESLLRTHQDMRVQPYEFWAALVEQFHVQLGMLMAERWNLSEVVKQVIAYHHWPERAAEHQQMVALVATVDQIQALLAREQHLTSAALESVQGLAPGEPQWVERLLPKVPPVVASFQGRPVKPAAPSAGVIERSATTLVGRPRQLNFAIRTEQEGAQTSFTASYITGDGLGMSGKAPLVENTLAKLVVEIDAGGSIDLWSNITLCSVASGGYLVEAKPFGLGAEVKARWDQLFQTAAVTAP